MLLEKVIAVFQVFFPMSQANRRCTFSESIIIVIYKILRRKKWHNICTQLTCGFTCERCLTVREEPPALRDLHRGFLQTLRVQVRRGVAGREREAVVEVDVRLQDPVAEHPTQLVFTCQRLYN